MGCHFDASKTYKFNCNSCTKRGKPYISNDYKSVLDPWILIYEIISLMLSDYQFYSTTMFLDSMPISYGMWKTMKRMRHPKSIMELQLLQLPDRIRSLVSVWFLWTKSSNLSDRCDLSIIIVATQILVVRNLDDI